MASISANNKSFNNDAEFQAAIQASVMDQRMIAPRDFEFSLFNNRRNSIMRRIRVPSASTLLEHRVPAQHPPPPIISSTHVTTLDDSDQDDVMIVDDKKKEKSFIVIVDDDDEIPSAQRQQPLPRLTPPPKIDAFIRPKKKANVEQKTGTINTDNDEEVARRLQNEFDTEYAMQQQVAANRFANRNQHHRRDIDVETLFPTAPSHAEFNHRRTDLMINPPRRLGRHSSMVTDNATAQAPTLATRTTSRSRATTLTRADFDESPLPATRTRARVANVAERDAYEYIGINQWEQFQLPQFNAANQAPNPPNAIQFDNLFNQYRVTQVRTGGLHRQHGAAPLNRVAAAIARTGRTNVDFTPEDYDDLLRLDEGIKKGVSKSDFDSLPQFEFRATMIDTTNTTSCSICFDEFEVKVKVTALACSHKFHKKCIQKWLHAERRCPLCQKDAITGA